MARSSSDQRGFHPCASFWFSGSLACWPSSSTAPSAWRTASRRPRCSWLRVSLRPLPRPPSTSPRSVPRWSRATHTTSSATSTGRPCRSWPSPGSSGPSSAPPSCPACRPTRPKPWVAGLLLALGIYVIYRFLVLGGRRPTFKARPSGKFLVPMGLVGGTLDSIGGGGWGPVGTTTLLSSGRFEPRKVVGSIDTSEFVVAVGGSLGLHLGAGFAGHRVVVRRRAADRWRHRRPDRGLAGPAPRRPRARCRGRWPDRADQLQDDRRVPRRVRSDRRRHRRRHRRRVDQRHRLGGPPGAPLREIEEVERQLATV